MKERTSNGEKALNASIGKRYRVLVIGAGGQGALADAPGSGNESKVISYGHALKEHPGFKIVGFVDRISLASYNAMQFWGGVATSTRYACEQLCTDVAIVATSDDQHYDTLLELIQYPLKLVICEKPITTNLDQAREIVELYRAKGVPLMVNYTRRFLPYHRELKRRYEAGEFGKLLDYEIKYNRGLFHTGSHAIDFMRWFTGLEENGHYLPKGLDMFSLDEDGCVINSRIKEVPANYRVWQLELFFEKYHWREERIDNQPVWDYYDQAMYHVINNAYNFLEGREPLYCDGEDALQTLEVCFKLMEGAR